MDGNWARVNDNGRLGSIAGEVIQEAIPINALKNKNSQAKGTYALAAYATDNVREYVAIVTVEQYSDKVTDIKLIDTAHSISARANRNIKRENPSAELRGYDMTADSARDSLNELNIADFLNIVKQTHESILSDDVLTVLKGTRDYCDVCDYVLSLCADGNMDHRCDICRKELTKCADDNGDGKCDVCGKTMYSVNLSVSTSVIKSLLLKIPLSCTYS